ncbi:hypothetical protein EDC65_4259 [Stella humosa]|uniref:Anti-sigma factor NepR domain-containing protein n=1 Tax=Stella humosa TaxID=94 RepID=A0A3N1KYC4_9PROT|nr:NepR family anti-sigma factor [Stella humosa]ROP83610.1 hypothetical protein EDC65_4259 [Stella humosa]BBK33116.1 hypothetical protein STHU_37500 [Stella humosa]
MDQDRPIPTDQEQAAPAGSSVAATGDAAATARTHPQTDWIDARLKSLYEAVVAEPLPDDLQAFIDKLVDQPAKPDR